MRTRRNTINTAQIKDETRNWYAFEEPWGEVVHNTRYFFAWKDGLLIGTYNSLEEAMESLACRERLKTHETYAEAEWFTKVYPSRRSAPNEDFSLFKQKPAGFSSAGEAVPLRTRSKEHRRFGVSGLLEFLSS